MGGASPRARTKPSRALPGALLLLVLLATVAGGLYRWAADASGPSVPVSVEVSEGATAAEIGDLLERVGVIRSSLAFRLTATVRGLDLLQAGVYRLSTNMTIAEVLPALEAGPAVEDVTLTVPEGFEVADMAELAEAILGIPAVEFRVAARSGRFALPPYLLEGTETVEGFLFPETYGFPQHVGADEVILRLLQQFREEVADLPWERARSLDLRPYEVVIVASMIEREARVPADRPKIAAVIYNRLEEWMPLQIDATVQYALPGDNRELTFEDYKLESPYNTYIQPGLPPTPIASPSLASLRAALEPADADYLYFVVVDPKTGRHGFAQTYDQFLRLKRRAGL